MRTLRNDQMDALWDKFWNQMSQEWFKLEVLQDYTGEDDGPSLRAWLKGNRQKSIELLRTDDDPEFTKDCRDKLSKGAKLLRVHVTEEPLSPYMEWELEYYKHVSMPLRGERVLIVRKSALAGLKLPGGDLMIFDSRRAIVNSYNKNGLAVAADFYDEHDDLADFLKLQNDLLRLAEPLNY